MIRAVKKTKSISQFAEQTLATMKTVVAKAAVRRFSIKRKDSLETHKETTAPFVMKLPLVKFVRSWPATLLKKNIIPGAFLRVLLGISKKLLYRTPVM